MRILFYCGSVKNVTEGVCITASGNILPLGKISLILLKLFLAPLETIDLLTFWYVVTEHHFVQL